MNRKKHTKIKRNISFLSILIPCFLIFGCARDVTPPVAIPVAPPIRQSASPQFIKVSKGIDDTIKSNYKIEEKVKQQLQEILNQRINITETITNTEKLKNQLKDYSDISNEGPTNIIDGLRKIEARNLFLEKQNGELSSLQKEQAEILRMTKDDATITYRKLLDKEQEANDLRSQNSFLGKNLLIKNGEVQQLQKDLEKAKIDAAKAKVYKYWVWGLVGGFVLWTIIKNVLMIYMPTSRFRI
jgi:hypothetical protein